MTHHTPVSVKPSHPIDEERRHVLKGLALACGLALSATSINLLAATFSNPRDVSRRKDRLLNPQQLALVRELGELIIPTTDTPGAIGADVHNFIDHQAAYCFNREEQHALLSGLRRIDDAAQQKYGSVFLSCAKNQQIELLTLMEKAEDGFTTEDRQNFKQLKALVVFGYYTSEIGASKELAYLAIPGGYKGSVKFSSVGKAWSLNF